MQQCHYKLRIDLDKITLSIAVDILYDASTLVWSLEDEDVHPHTHMYVVTPIKEMTLRARFRVNNLHGNGSYSLKELEKDKDQPYALEYLAYLIKQRKYWYRGISEWDLDQALVYDDLVKDSISEYKLSKKSQLVQISHYIEEYAKKNEMELNFGYQELCRFVVEWHKEKGILFREFSAISLVQTLYLKYSSNGINNLVEKMMDKLEKNNLF